VGVDGRWERTSEREEEEVWGGGGAGGGGDGGVDGCAFQRHIWPSVAAVHVQVSGYNPARGAGNHGRRCHEGDATAMEVGGGRVASEELLASFEAPVLAK
jgi:hypothetical protein